MITVDVYKKAVEGDIDAIERICLATWEPLYRFIYYRVQNREEAEDITQETYVKTLNYIQKDKFPQENFLGFLKTVSLNLIRDRWRQKKRRGVSVNLQEITPEETACSDKQNEIAQRLVLESALAKLSQEQQTILDLRIIKGYSVAETAKLVGKTEGAVRIAQYRALKALAQILDDSTERQIGQKRRENIEQ
ncbi:MAG: RNA polymerase sigma factor [Tepidanaerobacteraceae bacterium]